jgi:ATP-dependent DNA helicase RecG
MFLMIGGGEPAGSGADTIRSGWRAQHWRAPQIRFQDQPDRVMLTLPMLSLVPDETLQFLREQFGRLVQTLSPSELQALATAHIEGAVSNVHLQELLTDHPVDITRMLQCLCERGFLVSDNRRRWTRYRLPRPAAGESGPTGAGSVPLARDSVPFEKDSVRLEKDSVRLGDPSDESLRASAAPVATKGKAPAAAVRTVIATLSHGRFLTTESLARLLDRNADRLRKRYLTPTVQEGLLRLRYPESPNRPDQAYTAPDEP